MPYNARILLDSATPDGHRLTTFIVTYPRFVHAELMTHRVLSRNAASSRAIPVTKMINKVKNDPAMPVWYGKNQPGMQANEELDEETKEKVKDKITQAKEVLVGLTQELVELGLHKQSANRYLEPFMYITVIISATEWKNFFKLRCHKDAQPEFKKIAEMMKQLYDASVPQRMEYGQWHIPMIYPEEEDMSTEIKLKMATARCARISYETHDGKKELEEDIKRHDSLRDSGHWSPFEHCAQACNENSGSNFRGWKQYRKLFPGEDGNDL